MFANLHIFYLFPKKAQTLPRAELRPLKPVSSRLQVELKFPLMHDIAHYSLNIGIGNWNPNQTVKARALHFPHS